MEDKSEIFVYIEKFNKSSKYVLFDFVDSNEFTFFDLITAFNYKWEEQPTMVELVNYSNQNLQEGTVYRLLTENLRLIIPRVQIIEDSLVIGFKIELLDNDNALFGKSKSFNEIERFERNMDDTYDSELTDSFFNLPSIDKVIIRNVGQGSWNELLAKNQFSLIYDFGTIYSTKKTQVNFLIGNRDNEYQKSNPIFIFSHWDVDHYHFLLGFSNDTIKSIPHFIYRAAIPNLTARKALGRFRMYNPKALMPIAVVSAYPKRSSTVLKKYNLTTTRDILFYNASKNRSRNKSGLGLLLRKKDTSVVFSGDYDYSQISSYILPDACYMNLHYLIVPHHGGKAGKFIYNITKIKSLGEAIISVGKNPYKPSHPLSNYINDLKTKGFTIIRTDALLGDHTINL